LGKGTLIERPTDGFRPLLPGPMVSQDAMHRNGPQPSAEGAVALALEAGELAHQDMHDILDDILGFIPKLRIAQ
jgi:hypothetical protein